MSKQSTTVIDSEWRAAIAAKRAEGLSPTAAVRAVVQERQELHKRYLEAHNEGRPHALRGIAGLLA